MDIHKTKEATPEKIKLRLKVKDDIAKLTNFNIEKVYIMDQYAQGESDERPAYCFLTDVRIRDIDDKYRDVEDYSYKNSINILLWSMCQFEKRKNNPTELELKQNDLVEEVDYLEYRITKKGKEYIEIFIEVKGTNKSINEPFDISKNEIEASNKYKNQYYIYRVGNICSSNPKFYKINGKIEDNFTLEAISFRARKK